MALADRDSIFTNLYGLHSWQLPEARRRGNWDGTAGIIAKGRDWIIEEMKASGLREQVMIDFSHANSSKKYERQVDVGRDVAEAAELHEPELGGQDSRVGIVFVDLIGSTEMAVRSEASEVVDVLNQFFSVVVETVEEYDGIVDSFLGDAALVVPGDDPAAFADALARVDLSDRGVVTVTDPEAVDNASRAFPELNFVTDTTEALTGAPTD